MRFEICVWVNSRDIFQTWFLSVFNWIGPKTVWALRVGGRIGDAPGRGRRLHEHRDGGGKGKGSLGLGLRRFCEAVHLIFRPTRIVISHNFAIIYSTPNRNTQVVELKSWSSVGSAAWYCYGTLLCQGMSLYSESKSTLALRVFIATWILFFCLNISASYRGGKWGLEAGTSQTLKRLLKK